jgi:hypothetical protein
VLRKKLQGEAPRLYVGSVSVASDGKLLQHLEGLVGAKLPVLDRALLDELCEQLLLPQAATVETPRATDLAVDVVLQRYRFGSASDFWLGSASIPMYWRPKVRVAARLYHLQSQETKATFLVSQAVPWSAYLNRVLSWRVLLGLEPPAGRSILVALLRRATERLLAAFEPLQSGATCREAQVAV